MMGLFPEASGSSPITSTPKLCRRLFSFSDNSKSSGTLKSNDSNDSKLIKESTTINFMGVFEMSLDAAAPHPETKPAVTTNPNVSPAQPATKPANPADPNCGCGSNCSCTATGPSVGWGCKIVCKCGTETVVAAPPKPACGCGKKSACEANNPACNCIIGDVIYS